MPSHGHAALIPDASDPLACACLKGSADAHPAAQAWHPTEPPNRLRLIGLMHIGIDALRASFTSSEACLWHAVALAARRWSVAFLAAGRSSVFPLLHR